ncbi:MAG TPA: hypothetical protein VLA21_00735, partial [Candidatus Limnocylindria bacterium]|nr:hypothetical protein [Candidatus Limnocylindria bacterium]
FGRVYKITAAQMDTVQKEEGDKPHWYGNRVPLGTLDGLPVCTLTRMPEHDFTRPNLPSGKYLETIRLGLAETYPGLDADAYLDRALRRTEVLNLDARAAGT